MTKYKGISIYAVTKEGEQTCKPLAGSNFVFKIEDGLGVATFIDAAAFGVFRNKLDFAKSSLGDFMWSEMNQKELWSKDNEEFRLNFR